MEHKEVQLIALLYLECVESLYSGIETIENLIGLEVGKLVQTNENEKVMSGKSFIAENGEGITDFFETEKRLLNYLYRLEKAEAQKVMRLMIEKVSEGSKGNKLSQITYYFITLSGIVTRYLRKHYLTDEKAFGFNQTCIMLIENKLTEDNVVDFGDELIEFITYMIADRKPPVLKHHTVNNVLQFINNRVESPMSVEEISKEFDVSASHLSRIFREHAGITLVEYINVRKIEEAQYYLRFSDHQISDISTRFHFCNQSYFTRMFKKYTGDTPRRFRTNIGHDYFRYRLPGEE